ncbi:helix-turn-helix domain-containing protein [Dyadobacter jiangsuensis]
MQEEIKIRLAEELTANATESKEFPPQKQYFVESVAPQVIRWEKGYLASQRVPTRQFTTYIFVTRTIEPLFTTLEIQSPSAVLAYVAKGGMGIRLGDKITKFDQDRLIEFYSGKQHCQLSINSGFTVVYCFLLPQPFLLEVCEEYPSLAPILPALNSENREATFLASAKINPGTIDDFIRLKMGKKHGFGLQTVFSWLVFELIHQLKPNGSNKNLTIGEKAFHAKDYIDENVQFGVLLGVNEIANRYGVHSDTLNRAFKGAFDITLKKYINRAKMREGYRLLTLEAQPVMQVAERLGYQSASSFSTQFKAHFGLSPSDAVASYIAGGDPLK